MSNLDKTRHVILARALVHVVFDGWSWKALNAAAKDANIDPIMLKRAFPKGPRDLVYYFSESADKLMLEELRHLDIGSLPIRERVATAIKTRLQQNIIHKDALRKLLSYLALPRNFLLSAGLTYRTVDSIWYFAGDNSTDFNFYTKRGLLAGVYTSTILYWLADQSEDCANTWAFLDRRISEVLKIPSLTGAFKKQASSVLSKFKRTRSRIIL